eukprot:1814627-Amphidinium_carterae.1
MAGLLTMPGPVPPGPLPQRKMEQVLGGKGQSSWRSRLLAAQALSSTSSTGSAKVEALTCDSIPYSVCRAQAAPEPLHEVCFLCVRLPEGPYAQ